MAVMPGEQRALRHGAARLRGRVRRVFPMCRGRRRSQPSVDGSQTVTGASRRRRHTKARDVAPLPARALMSLRLFGAWRVETPQ